MAKAMARHARFLIILFLILMVGIAAYAHAAVDGSIEVTSESAGQSLGGGLSYLGDANERFSILDISDPKSAGLFQELKGDIPHLGRQNGAVWLRFSLNNTTGDKQSRYLVYAYPVTDYVALYTPKQDGTYARMISGDASMRSPEVVPNRLIVFPVELPPNSNITYYMRFRSTGDMAFPLSVWDPAAFFKKDHWSQMGYGLFFGCCFGFIIYFFVIAWRLHSAPAAWFVVYVLAIAMLMGFRQGFMQEIMGQSLRIYNNPIHLLSIALLYFSGAKFLRVFLNIKRHMPKADRVIQILQWMGLGFIPMAILYNPLTQPYALVLIGIGPWFSTTIAVILWIKGVSHARYFAIGMLIGHIASTVDFLRISGFIPYLEFSDTMMPLAMVSAMAFYTVALIEKTREYKLQSDMDTLTGLANRRKMNQHLAEEWNRAMRHQRPLALIMADVDCFKDYNDNYGHSAGDECLKRVARVLHNSARRPGDLVARFGGEEFLLCLPETDLPQAETVAESIRLQVCALNIRHGHSLAAEVLTLSLGVVSAVPHDDLSPGLLIEQADKALYEAKQKGRNCVMTTCAPPPIKLAAQT